MIVFTEPIKIIYTNMTSKIGQPRESKNFLASMPLNANLNIPAGDIIKNLDVEEHEIVFA